MKVIAISNQKGGVGKTTLASHLAFLAEDKKLKTLIIDFDEGDLSSLFLSEDLSEKNYLVASQLFEKGNNSKTPLAISPYLSIIPADVHILDVDDLSLETVINPKENIKKFSENFDLCIIDTPPNLQRRLVAALTMANAVVVPINIDSFSIARLQKLQTTIVAINSNLNPDLEFLGVLPNKINSRSQNEKKGIIELKKSLGEFFIDYTIFTRASVPVALAKRAPVWKNVKSGNQRTASKEMKNACNAILKKLAL